MLELFSFYLIWSSVLFFHFCVIVGILNFPTWFLQWSFHLQFIWICMFSVASLTFDFYFYSFIEDRLQKKKQFPYHVFVNAYCTSCTRNSSQECTGCIFAQRPVRQVDIYCPLAGVSQWCFCGYFFVVSSEGNPLQFFNPALGAEDYLCGLRSLLLLFYFLNFPTSLCYWTQSLHHHPLRRMPNFQFLHIFFLGDSNSL